MDESFNVALPSPSGSELRRWLAFGAYGALVAGLLAAASSALSLVGWQEGAFSLSEFLNLAALLALSVVLGAYWQVSLHTQTPGLRKSGLGLYGVLIIMELASLNFTEGDWHWWNIVIWIVMALATIILLIVVWKLEEIETGVAADSPHAGPRRNSEAKVVASAASADATAGLAQRDGKTAPGRSVIGTRVGWAGLAVLGLFVLKVLLKVTARIAVKKVGKFMDADQIGGLLLPALLIGVVVFVVWFAVVKIRQRKVLGAFAAVVGAVELLIILLGVSGLGGIVFAMFLVFRQVGFDEKALEAGFDAVQATWSRPSDAVALVVSVIWASMTAGFLLSCRRRLA